MSEQKTHMFKASLATGLSGGCEICGQGLINEAHIMDEPKAAPQEAPDTSVYDPTKVPDTIWVSADWTIQGHWSGGEWTDGEFAEAIFPDSVQYTHTAVSNTALADLQKRFDDFIHTSNILLIEAQYGLAKARDDVLEEAQNALGPICDGCECDICVKRRINSELIRALKSGGDNG